MVDDFDDGEGRYEVSTDSDLRWTDAAVEKLFYTSVAREYCKRGASECYVLSGYGAGKMRC